MRLPPRGVVRFLGWHVLKLEFWHFAHPKLNLGFVFASVFAVFSSKKNAATGALHCPKTCSALHFASFLFGVFLCTAFRIGFCSVFADSRLSAHAGSCRLRLAFVFQLCAGVGGGMGGGGDNVHANAACVFCFLLLFPMCRISHYCFSFETSTMQKPRVFFAAFQTNTSKTTQKINLTKSKKSMVFATLSQKRYQKTRTKNMGKTKTPTHRVVDENLANYRVCLTSTKKNLPTINDTPRAAADARAT